MSDGLNEARSLRILEIMNDFRTLQLHISSHLQRPQARVPDNNAIYEEGYVVLRQCSADAQAILATHFNPGSLGLQNSDFGEGEVQKATLQRIILDASTRRFQAHKIYLRASAAVRWCSRREQILRGEKPNGRHQTALRRSDVTLREELSAITDAYVVGDLRNADRRAGHWLAEDPELDRILSWIRIQR
ncbi:hypothetical protein UCRPC4_g04945 [Phaeomoniella chlamydospora]|uniref:Uncharacterized protein n=1 Tax=Phaeomoniella chlamydospora TaxID=158046 RepID=A0A0G2E710_PHACM|nr:hypothetical protein UCRPC4_g04945 [Phaeomoniella chlamydospora]